MGPNRLSWCFSPATRLVLGSKPPIELVLGDFVLKDQWKMVSLATAGRSWPALGTKRRPVVVSSLCVSVASSGVVVAAVLAVLEAVAGAGCCSGKESTGDARTALGGSILLSGAGLLIRSQYSSHLVTSPIGTRRGVLNF